jgi:hypothetical protein
MRKDAPAKDKGFVELDLVGDVGRDGLETPTLAYCPLSKRAASLAK